MRGNESFALLMYISPLRKTFLFSLFFLFAAKYTYIKFDRGAIVTNFRGNSWDQKDKLSFLDKNHFTILMLCRNVEYGKLVRLRVVSVNHEIFYGC